MKLPFCIQCQKSVDRMVQYDDPTHLGSISFQVFCHGETETTVLPRSVLMTLNKLFVGQAFLGPRQLIPKVTATPNTLLTSKPVIT